MASHVDSKYDRKTTGAPMGRRRKVIPVSLPQDVLKGQITQALSTALKAEKPPTPEEILQSAQAALGAIMISTSGMNDLEKMSVIVSRVVKAATDIIRATSQNVENDEDDEIIKKLDPKVVEQIQDQVNKIYS